MFQTLLLFLGCPAKKYVAGDVHAAQGSSLHRVSDGQRRTRQLPKVKRRVSSATVQQVVPATLFFHATDNHALKQKPHANNAWGLVQAHFSVAVARTGTASML